MKTKAIEDLFGLPLPFILIILGLMMLDDKIKFIAEEDDGDGNVKVEA